MITATRIIVADSAIPFDCSLAIPHQYAGNSKIHCYYYSYVYQQCLVLVCLKIRWAIIVTIIGAIAAIVVTIACLPFLSLIHRESSRYAYACKPRYNQNL